MKLAARLFCVAALSLVGCADVQTNGGGQGEGIKPAKTAFIDPNDLPEPFNPVIAGMQQVGGVASADYLCDGCEIVTYKLLAETGAIDEVRLVKQEGDPVCHVYMADGMIVIDECGIFTP